MRRLFEETYNHHFDMIIIGGGITGAFVAYEAASRGLKVALFEKGDFGEATSAATSKLIHGGLRYLKNFEYSLVRESLDERRTLENIAPNFVYPLAFMIPTYKNLKNNKTVLRIGMWLYDILSYDKAWTWDQSKKLPLHKTIGAELTKALESNVMDNKLTGSSIYYDCQNLNPDRLTLAVIKSAISKGAQVSNYAKVESLILDNNTVTGAQVLDIIHQKHHKFTADITINCTGPWSDIVLNSSVNNNKIHHIRRSEGIHLITKKLCNKHAITMMTESGRHVMLLPWRNHTIIGTTDKTYEGKPDDYHVTKDSIIGLLNEINAIYQSEIITYSDILFAYGGMRPLVDNETEGSYNTSRKYEICDNTKDGFDHLISVEGGKYTTSRNLAEQLIYKVEKKLHKKLKKVDTRKEYLSGSAIKDIEKFINELKLQYPEFSTESVEYIGRNYGLECHDVFALAKEDPKLAKVLTADGEILAEVAYAIKNEIPYSLSDIIFRRTGIGTLGYPGDDIFNTVVSLCREMLQWDDKRTQMEIQEAKKLFTLPE